MMYAVLSQRARIYVAGVCAFYFVGAQSTDARIQDSASDPLFYEAASDAWLQSLNCYCEFKFDKRGISEDGSVISEISAEGFMIFQDGAYRMNVDWASIDPGNVVLPEISFDFSGKPEVDLF